MKSHCKGQLMSEDTTPVFIPFHAHAGIEILRAPVGSGHARIPETRTLTNHLGTVHGGALFSVGEVAAAAAITQLLSSEMMSLRAITRRATIEYLKPARGVIDGHATVDMTRSEILAALEHVASVDVPISVTLTDLAQVAVATLTVTWFVGRPRKP
jgi:uncharacterized protein (TIGR00369 family)